MHLIPVAFVQDPVTMMRVLSVIYHTMMEEYNKKNQQNQQEVLITIVHFMEACVAKWLTPQTPDLEVWGSSLAHRVVSLDKKLYSTLSLFT